MKKFPEKYLKYIDSWHYNSGFDEVIFKFQPITASSIPGELDYFLDIITYSKEPNDFATDGTLTYFISGSKKGHSKVLIDQLEKYCNGKDSR